MDHILLLEHQYSSLKHCDPGVARFRRSVSASQAIFALSAISSLALFLSLSMHISFSSTVSARLLEVGSLFMTKKALFVLSNGIFLFLAADYCRFFTIGASTSDGLAPAEQSQHQQEAEQCASDNCTHIGKENHVESRANLGVSDNTILLEGHEERDVPVSRKSDLFKLGEEDSVTLETVVIEEQEPTCRTAQELDKLDIDELNEKFEEFIRSRRIKWVEEQEGCLQWQEKVDNTSAVILAC